MLTLKLGTSFAAKAAPTGHIKFQTECNSTLATKPQSAWQVAGYPAQAGIQLIEEIPRSVATPRFCPLREVFVLLDSRLRGNDGGDKLSGV